MSRHLDMDRYACIDNNGNDCVRRNKTCCCRATYLLSTCTCCICVSRVFFSELVWTLWTPLLAWWGVREAVRLYSTAVVHIIRRLLIYFQRCDVSLFSFFLQHASALCHQQLVVWPLLFVRIIHMVCIINELWW